MKCNKFTTTLSTLEFVIVSKREINVYKKLILVS